MSLKQDYKFKVKWESGENVCINVDGKSHFIYKAGIRDETNQVVSWYYHDLFKKIKFVYCDTATKQFWLPRNKLYSKLKLKRFYKNSKIDNKAFFFKSYFLSLIGIEVPQDGMSGLLPPGESLF